MKYKLKTRHQRQHFEEATLKSLRMENKNLPRTELKKLLLERKAQFDQAASLQNKRNEAEKVNSIIKSPTL